MAFFRDCPSCGDRIPIRKRKCACGYAFRRKKSSTNFGAKTGYSGRKETKEQAEERQAADRRRQAQKRSQETEEEACRRRATDRRRKALKISEETEEEASRRRAANRRYQALSRSKKTEEQASICRAAARRRKALKISQETEEEASRRRAANRRYQALSRSKKTEEQASICRAAARRRKALKISQETEEEASRRRVANRRYQALSRSKKTGEQASVCRAAARRRKALKISQETEEEASRRRAANRRYQALRRSRETEEQASRRRAANGRSQALKRASLKTKKGIEPVERNHKALVLEAKEETSRCLPTDAKHKARVVKKSLSTEVQSTSCRKYSQVRLSPNHASVGDKGSVSDRELSKTFMLNETSPRSNFDALACRANDQFNINLANIKSSSDATCEIGTGVSSQLQQLVGSVDVSQFALPSERTLQRLASSLGYLSPSEPSQTIKSTTPYKITILYSCTTSYSQQTPQLANDKIIRGTRKQKKITGVQPPPRKSFKPGSSLDQTLNRLLVMKKLDILRQGAQPVSIQGQGQSDKALLVPVGTDENSATNCNVLSSMVMDTKSLSAAESRKNRRKGTPKHKRLLSSSYATGE